MANPRYQVVPHPISTILTWVKSKAIAIPEIQRPFVWDSTQVRDLLDSLYKSYPVGYLISWSNPNVRLKDGGYSEGKRILIDGQQRVTALMAALLAQPIINKDYQTTRITIAFNPIEEKFEVLNPVISKSKEWIPDVAAFFAEDVHILNIVKEYVAKNPEQEENKIYDICNNLIQIKNNMVGVIDLSNELDIETVTEIFIRVNSQGTQLSQADFAMSKIAANEDFEGHILRKAIEYFCHLSVAPEFKSLIEANDKEFTKTDYYAKMKWIAKVNEDLYDPSYTDMLRVAFTSEFHRGRLQDLVALLSGRNFETREYESAIAEESFKTLKNGILNFMNETNFQRFVIILKSAGFTDSSLIGSMNVIDFAYIVFLYGRSNKINPGELETIVRQWLIMPMLTGRYSGTPESAFDADIRGIKTHGLVEYTKTVMKTELNESFWSTMLPQQLETSSTNSPVWAVFCASQIFSNDKGFLSKDITVGALINNKGDIHHIYPRKYLKKQGRSRTSYNQIANFVFTQSEINIAIGDKAPAVYMKELKKQIDTGKLKYGVITQEKSLMKNFEMNAIPWLLFKEEEIDFDDFLDRRRHLMAAKIRDYFAAIGLGETLDSE